MLYMAREGVLNNYKDSLNVPPLVFVPFSYVPGCSQVLRIIQNTADGVCSAVETGK